MERKKKWGKLWRNCRDEEGNALKKCWEQLSRGKREWQRKGSLTHCAGSHTEDLSDSRTKMDSIFISALNLVSPPESASYQFFPHTQVCELFPFSCSLLPKERRRIFSQWVSFWDTGLVHLRFSQYIELLLFTLKLKCFLKWKMGSGLLFHARLESLIVIHGELGITVLLFIDRLQDLKKILHLLTCFLHTQIFLEN